MYPPPPTRPAARPDEECRSNTQSANLTLGLQFKCRQYNSNKQLSNPDQHWSADRRTHESELLQKTMQAQLQLRQRWLKSALATCHATDR